MSIKITNARMLNSAYGNYKYISLTVQSLAGEIKYLYITIRFFNAVGDVCGADVRYKTIGPIHKHSFKMCEYNVLYEEAKSFNIVKVDIEYLGGNVETLKESEIDIKKVKEGCYVATAVYGSYDCPQVWTLRRFRDYTLAATWWGKLFIRLYYAISPTLVKLFGHTKWFKKMWKGKLDRMVSKLNAKGVEDTPYEDRNW